MLDFLLLLVSHVVPWRRDRLRCTAVLRRAQRAWRRQRFPESEALFEQSLSLGLTDSRPSVQYAWALLDQGDAPRAVELLEGAVEMEPENPVPLIMLGLAQSDAGRQAEACETLRAACGRAPLNLLAATSLALAHLRAGQPAAANSLLGAVADNLAVRARLLVELEKPLQHRNAPPHEDLLPPPSEDAHQPEIDPKAGGRRCFNQAVKAFHKGKYKTAAALLNAAVSRNFNSDEARLYLAGTELGLGNHEPAAKLLAEMPPNSMLRGPALFYSGLARYLNNEPQAARELLDKAANAGGVHDFDEFIHYYRGLCFLADGNELAARREFEPALDVNCSLLSRRLSAAAGFSAAEAPAV
ncbi:MAG TPA: tetratricopeptide repeat protein [Planctomycetota bacterium]|nr:tetratricopeptide repeat protein [Planctomycetota bacterium]